MGPGLFGRDLLNSPSGLAAAGRIWRESGRCCFVFELGAKPCFAQRAVPQIQAFFRSKGLIMID
jgi:hypothetical protein